MISEVELGRLEEQKWGVLRRIFEALDGSLEAMPRWRGAELDRLLDADHATLTEDWSRDGDSSAAGGIRRVGCPLSPITPPPAESDETGAAAAVATAWGAG